MFIHFDRMHERDRQTHTDRETLHDGIGRTCIALHSKKLTNMINESKITHYSAEEMQILSMLK